MELSSGSPMEEREEVLYEKGGIKSMTGKVTDS